MQQGSIVVLKSGGPRMTVTSRQPDDNGFVFCRWFNEDGSLEGSKFPVAALTEQSEVG